MNIFELTRILNEAVTLVDETKQNLRDRTKKKIDVYSEIQPEDSNEKEKVLSKMDRYMSAEIAEAKNEASVRMEFLQRIQEACSGIVDVSFFKDIISDMYDEEIESLNDKFELSDLKRNNTYFKQPVGVTKNEPNPSVGWRRLCNFSKYGIGKFELILALKMGGYLKSSKKGKELSQKYASNFKGDVIYVDGNRVRTIEVKTKGGAISYGTQTKEDYLNNLQGLIYFNDDGSYRYYDTQDKTKKIEDFFGLSSSRVGGDERNARVKIKGILNRN